MPRDFKIFDADDQIATVKLALEHLNIKDPGEKVRGLLERISFAKNHGQTPAQIATEAAKHNDPLGITASKVYAEYENILRKAGALDFDDLLLRAVQVLREFPEARTAWQTRFRYIHVDEYQDTNRVQYDLLRLLVSESRNLCVVGDEDQSIYRWRGADIGNILRFEEDYPGARVVRLEENYRSTQKILDAAAGVVSNNRRRLGKNLKATRSSGTIWRFLRAAIRKPRRSTLPMQSALSTVMIRPFTLPFSTARTRSRAPLKRLCARAACAIACWADSRFTSAPR